MKEAADAFPYWTQLFGLEFTQQKYLTIFIQVIHHTCPKFCRKPCLLTKNHSGLLNELGRFLLIDQESHPAHRLKTSRAHMFPQKSPGQLLIRVRYGHWSIAQFHFAILQRLSPKVIKPVPNPFLTYNSWHFIGIHYITYQHYLKGTEKVADDAAY